RYNQADVWEFRPRKLSLLSEVREKMSKSLAVQLPITSVNEALTTQLAQAVAHAPGPCKLTVTVTAPEEAMQVALCSQQYRIQPSDALFAALRPLEGITYRLQA
ncbi:MAG: hypothetical protein AAF963_03480, partial [Bacteroidota bacterium]